MSAILLIIISWILFAGLFCLTVTMASSRFNQENEAAVKKHPNHAVWE